MRGRNTIILTLCLWAAFKRSILFVFSIASNPSPFLVYLSLHHWEMALIVSEYEPNVVVEWKIRSSGLVHSRSITWIIQKRLRRRTKTKICSCMKRKSHLRSNKNLDDGKCWIWTEVPQIRLRRNHHLLLVSVDRTEAIFDKRFMSATKKQSFTEDSFRAGFCGPGHRQPSVTCHSWQFEWL